MICPFPERIRPMTESAQRQGPVRRARARSSWTPGAGLCAALAVVAGLTGAAGCSASPSASAAPSASAPASSPTVPVPAPLAEIEAKAEDIIDQLDASGWAAIAADLTVVEKDWAAYAPSAPAAGVPEATASAVRKALDGLRAAATAKDTLGTMQAANDVSAAAVEMFDRYAVGHPVQIGRLDVIGRQLVIDAGRRDFAGTSSQLDRASQELSAVSASVSAHRGDAVLAQARGALDQARHGVDAQDAAAVTGPAKQLLEIVDAMEKLYA